MNDFLPRTKVSRYCDRYPAALKNHGKGKRGFLVRCFLALGFSIATPIAAHAACTSTAESVSVTSCGADSTGSSPSDTAFTAAFTAAQTTSKRVFVPCGTFHISSVQLAAPVDDFELYGSGSCTTIVMDSASYPHQGTLFSTNGHARVRINSLRISYAGTQNTNAIWARPGSAGGITNTVISDVYIEGVDVAIRGGSLNNPMVGLTISGSEIVATRSYSVFIQDVSNFTFVNNKVTNWYTKPAAGGGDAVNYDMTADTFNWVVIGNTFLSGENGSHALVQGPDHPDKVIRTAFFQKNTGDFMPGVSGVVGRGMGFGIACDQCTIADNEFKGENNAASGWRNCLEVYSKYRATIIGNSCQNGTLLAGAPIGGDNLDYLKIEGNSITSKGTLPGNVMSCIKVVGNAATGVAGTQFRHGEINSNICDATAAGTGNGVIGIDIGKDTSPYWGSITSLTVSNNTVQQPAINHGIRIENSPVISDTRVQNNTAAQGLRFRNVSAYMTTYSGVSVTDNTFHPGACQVDSGSIGAPSFSGNTGAGC